MANNNSSRSSSNGIGFIGALTILFIALKLTGFINWSWVWVLSPIWTSFVVIFVLLFALIFFASDKGRKRK